jgi:hypothetical protein
VTRRFLALVLTIACTLALSSCASNKSGDSSAPNGAEADTRTGAMAFASHWVDVLNQATTSGDTKALKRLATKGCTVCADFAHSLDKIYSRSGHVKSDGWDVLSEVWIAGQPKDNPGVQLNLKVAPQTVYRTKKAKPQTYRGGQQGLRVFLVRRGDHWLVDKLEPS